MRDGIPFLVVVGVAVIIGLLFWGAEEERGQAIARHRQQMADCQQAGHERLWCEGLLK